MSGYGGAVLWLCFLAIGLGTFLSRFSFIYYFGRITIPRRVIWVLGFVPAAVLSALIVPSVLLRDGIPAIGWDNERLVAAGIAAAVSAATRNMLLTIGSGMVALWVLQAI